MQRLSAERYSRKLNPRIDIFRARYYSLVKLLLTKQHQVFPESFYNSVNFLKFSLPQFIFKTNQKLTTPLQIHIFCETRQVSRSTDIYARNIFKGKRNWLPGLKQKAWMLCSEIAAHFHYKAVDKLWKTTSF